MKRNKLYVAVTGGIGSGKTTVLQILKDLGYPAVSADAEAREIYGDEEILEKVRALFPACFENGILRREKLAAFVFSDEKLLQKLNEITHPVIMQKVFQAMDRAESKIVFAEIPLLFEGNYQSLFDKVIVVMRNMEDRIRAVAERDGLSRTQILARIKKQCNYEKNYFSGHTVIYNNGDISSLKEQVVRIVNEFLSNANN